MRIEKKASRRRSCKAIHHCAVDLCMHRSDGNDRFGADCAAAGDQPARTEVEEVVITGTHIKGLDAETIVPVQVVTATDIQHTGATTTEQLLQTVSVALQGNSNTVTSTQPGRPPVASLPCRCAVLARSEPSCCSTGCDFPAWHDYG